MPTESKKLDSDSQLFCRQPGQQWLHSKCRKLHWISVTDIPANMGFILPLVSVHTGLSESSLPLCLLILSCPADTQVPNGSLYKAVDYDKAVIQLTYQPTWDFFFRWYEKKCLAYIGIVEG